VGKDENTITAFEKSLKKDGVNGVEIDVRRSMCGKEIVISHDPAGTEEALTLKEGLEFLSKYNCELFVELKECDKEFFYDVVGLLEEFNLKNRSLLFAFRDVAKNFVWDYREVKLGIISEYPWEIKKDIQQFNPDAVLLGWDDRWWTRLAFKSVWSVLSLDKLCKKYDKISFVVGVVNCEGDYNWLRRQNGLYCCTADRPFEWS